MRDLLVLAHHAVSPSWPAAFAVQPAHLEAQLEVLLERGYRGTTFTEAVTGRGAGRVLSITFDDGYRSVFERALPILSRLGLPGTIFVPTSFVGDRRPMSWPGIGHWVGGIHEHELASVTRDDLLALLEAGWEVGSHSRAHRRLTELADAELREDLRSSRAELEDALAGPCRSIAYPYGVVDRRVAEAAAEAGYEAGAALAPYELHEDPMRWPRVGVYRGDSPRYFAFKVSRIVRRIKLARARQAVPLLRSR